MHIDPFRSPSVAAAGLSHITFRQLACWDAARAWSWSPSPKALGTLVRGQQSGNGCAHTGATLATRAIAMPSVIAMHFSADDVSWWIAEGDAPLRAHLRRPRRRGSRGGGDDASAGALVHTRGYALTATTLRTLNRALSGSPNEFR